MLRLRVRVRARVTCDSRVETLNSARPSISSSAPNQLPMPRAAAHTSTAHWLGLRLGLGPGEGLGLGLGLRLGIRLGLGLVIASRTLRRSKKRVALLPRSKLSRALFGG